MNKAPRFLRIYDNGGKSVDRYTAIDSRPCKAPNGSHYYLYVAFNGCPTHPTYGFWQHGELSTLPPLRKAFDIDKRVSFARLPDICQTLLLQEFTK